MATADQKPEPLPDTGVGSEAWWSRVNRGTTVDRDRKRKSKSRNERVADLWAGYGWGETDDVEWDADEWDKQRVTETRTKSRYGGVRIQQTRDDRLGFKTIDRAITAQRMVQSFVDAFGTRDWGYKVVFVEGVSTAATSFELKTVVMDPRPIFDTSLTAQQCGLVLTGETCHEISHAEFDFDTTVAVNARWPEGDDNRALALSLSNLFAENRIERRFAARWPGFSDVFDPMLEYISRDTHGRDARWDSSKPTDFPLVSIRFARWANFPGWEAERDWWQALDREAQATDDPDVWVTIIERALERIDLNVKFGTPPPPPPPEGYHPFNPRKDAEKLIPQAADEVVNQYRGLCRHCNKYVKPTEGYAWKEGETNRLNRDTWRYETKTKWGVRHRTHPRIVRFA